MTKILIIRSDVTEGVRELENTINKGEQVIDIKYMIQTDSNQQDWMYAMIHYKEYDNVF